MFIVEWGSGQKDKWTPGFWSWEANEDSGKRPFITEDMTFRCERGGVQLSRCPVVQCRGSVMNLIQHNQSSSPKYIEDEKMTKRCIIGVFAHEGQETAVAT